MSTGRKSQSGCFPDIRETRRAHRLFDGATLERKLNKGFRRKYWMSADDLLPNALSIPRSVGADRLEHRDWAWLLEVWQDKPPGAERDVMLAECGRRLDVKDKQQVAA